MHTFAEHDDFYTASGHTYFQVTRSGLGINALTSGEPGYPHGGAVFHDTAVWIRRAEG